MSFTTTTDRNRDWDLENQGIPALRSERLKLSLSLLIASYSALSSCLGATEMVEDGRSNGSRKAKTLAPLFKTKHPGLFLLLGHRLFSIFVRCLPFVLIGRKELGCLCQPRYCLGAREDSSLLSNLLFSAFMVYRIIYFIPFVSL